jgi:hypothetical protein
MPQGNIKSVVGDLIFRTSTNGIVVLKGEKCKFEGQEYRFTARLEKKDGSWWANIVALTPRYPSKFKLQSCKAVLMTKLPDIWEEHIKTHKSIVFIADKQAAEAERKSKLAELQHAIERIEVLIATAKPLLTDLLK